MYNKITQANTIKNILRRIEFTKAYRAVSTQYVDALNVIYKFYKQCLDKTITKEKFIEAYKALQNVEGYSFFETFITNNGYKFNSNPALEQIYDSI